MEPDSLTVDGLYLQFAFLVMLLLVGVMYKVGDYHPPYYVPRAKLLGPSIFVFGILSVGVFLIAGPLAALATELRLPFSLSSSQSIGVALVTDAILVWSLIRRTGGSLDSPFLSALVSLPPLAIFLKVDDILLGVLLAILLATLLISSAEDGFHVPRPEGTFHACLYSTLMFLLLTVGIGWYTERCRVDGGENHSGTESWFCPGPPDPSVRSR